MVEASSTMNGKEISYPTLKQAIYSLTAFLNVRDFFFRFSEDLVVSILRLLRWMDTYHYISGTNQNDNIIIDQHRCRTLGG